MKAQGMFKAFRNGIDRPAGMTCRGGHPKDLRCGGRGRIMRKEYMPFEVYLWYTFLAFWPRRPSLDSSSALIPMA